MSISDSNGIFHRDDSQGILIYLNLRLEAGDITNEEALAILSAVHAELGKGSSADPRVYKLYNNTLKSLQQTMPSVYDYIVATWNRRHENNLNPPDDKGFINDGDIPSENKSQIVEVGRKEGLYGFITSGEELEKTDDGEEGSEESEEKEIAADEEKDMEPVHAETGEEKDQEAEEENEENDIKLEEEQHKEDEEADDDIKNESLQETDTDEPGAEEGSENENTNEDHENEADEEFIGEEVVNESPDGTEKLETEGNAGEDQGEEMEWPELEQSLPEEPIEGLEGGGNSAEPED